MARHVGLRCQLPIETPALTLNRLCGSGFQTVISAVQEINSGDAEVVLTGGTESMSQAPHAARNIRWGTRYGVDIKLEDTLAAALVDRYPVETPMGMTAEKLGKQYDITRQHCDEYALKSQKRWAEGSIDSNGHHDDNAHSVSVSVSVSVQLNKTVALRRRSDPLPSRVARVLKSSPLVRRVHGIG